MLSLSVAVAAVAGLLRYLLVPVVVASDPAMLALAVILAATDACSLWQCGEAYVHMTALQTVLALLAFGSRVAPVLIVLLYPYWCLCVFVVKDEFGRRRADSSNADPPAEV